MKPIVVRIACALALVSAVSLPLVAQKPGGDAFASAFFDPEFVIQNQSRIGFTSEQRRTFLEEMQRTQTAVLPLQLEMAEASIGLMAEVEKAAPDEETVLSAAGRVLEIEQRVKTEHLKLMVRVKNLLTEAQQDELRALRKGQ